MKHQNQKELSFVFLKGMAMGAADVVPGVSGGTIALITGIYLRLLDALKSCTPKNLVALLRGDKKVWLHIDGTFLLVLLLGILVSFLSLSKVVKYCLDHYPIPLWSFFFGLICASAVFVAMQITRWSWKQWLSLLTGVSLALLISFLRPAELPDTWWVLVLAGSIAVCALILPGISGSFMLLMMGLYSTIMDAINELRFLTLGCFVVGCVIGLLSFSRFLSWLLTHYYNTVMASMVGFLLGSLYIIWPWKETVESMFDLSGNQRPSLQRAVLPGVYQGDPQVALAILFCVLGFALVLTLEKLSNK